MNSKYHRGFTLVSVLVSIVITIFVGIAASYIAIMLSALPWPIILSVILSYSLLSIISKIRKEKYSIHDVNVAQAGGSIGGLMAAGVAFTLPAIWYLNEVYGANIDAPSIISIILTSILAGILGVLLSLQTREFLIEKEKLPFPSGLAGAEVLKALNKGGISLELVFYGIILAGIFTIVKQIILLQPFLRITLLVAGLIIIIEFIPLLTAVGTGYIIGEKQSLSWFLGAIFGWFILMPLLQISKFTNYISPVKNLGMGVVFGAGLSFFVLQILPGMTKMVRETYKQLRYQKLILLVSFITIALLISVGIHPILALLAVIGAWVASAMAGKSTGETNIDPLEQFGLMVGWFSLILLSFIGFNVKFTQVLLVTMFVSIAAAVSGDIGHDYKSAEVIGTEPLDITRVDLITSIVAGVVAPISVLVVIRAFYSMIFSPDSALAFQSKLVGEALYGFAYPQFFIAGLLIGFLLETISMYFRKSRGEPLIGTIAFGVGIFLGFALAIPIILGALIHTIIKKKKPELEENGLLIFSGIMGGEGLVGFVLGLLIIFGITGMVVNIAFLLVFVAILVTFILHKHLISRDQVQ